MRRAFAKMISFEILKHISAKAFMAVPRPELELLNCGCCKCQYACISVGHPKLCKFCRQRCMGIMLPEHDQDTCNFWHGDREEHTPDRLRARALRVLQRLEETEHEDTIQAWAEELAAASSIGRFLERLEGIIDRLYCVLRLRASGKLNNITP